MPQDPAPMDQLRDEPLRFLETEQFQEMLSVYRKLKPLEQENPRKFRNQLNTYDFSDIYPIMDTYLQTRALSDPEAVSAVIAEATPESVAFASRCWTSSRPRWRSECRNMTFWATAPPPTSSAACGPT